MTQATLSGGSMAEIPDPGPRPLWTGEVAQLAGVTRMTINRWANAGRLPHVRTLGGNRRYEQADVKKLLLYSAKDAFTLAGQLYLLNLSVSGRPDNPLYLFFHEKSPGSMDS